MKIATVAQHKAETRVVLDSNVLAQVGTAIRQQMGYGVSWKSGAAYITLKGGELVVIPQRKLAATMKKYGAYVESVR